MLLIETNVEGRFKFQLACNDFFSACRFVLGSSISSKKQRISTCLRRIMRQGLQQMMQRSVGEIRGACARLMMMMKKKPEAGYSERPFYQQQVPSLIMKPLDHNRDNHNDDDNEATTNTIATDSPEPMTRLPKWLNALSFFPCRIRSRMPCVHACSRAASDLLENFPLWKICFSCCYCTGIETCILDRQSAATQKL